MDYRNLGNSGLKVSVIGLGTNQFGGKVRLEESKNIIHAALDKGVNLIDTADVYQQGRSEEYIGRALKGHRERALIATKVRHPTGDRPNEKGLSRHHILNGVETSLRRLKTEFIDLYQVHRWDPESPIEETMRTFEDLVRSGKVRYIGASNFTAWQFTHANAVALENGWTQFVSIQPHYHMLERGIEKDIVPACEYFNVGILPYFPLAGGFLTGKYNSNEPAPIGSRGETSKYVQRYMKQENYDLMEVLREFAQQRGHSVNELAHAWLLARSQVASVISGATHVEHVEANTKAANWKLSRDEIQAVVQILEGK